jgi:3-deoxy-D-manno-octulosonic-acid transferase
MDSVMHWLLNSVYVLLLTCLSPLIVWRMMRHGRYRRGLATKLLGRLQRPPGVRPVVWFHAVSVGEVVQLQKIVLEFRRATADRFAVLVTTSTDTGFDLAQQRFPDCTVDWFPLDFSWAVRNAISRVQPVQVVLMELELWPGFMAACRNRGIPVAIVNARLSERSFRRYQRVRGLLQPMFSGLRLIAAQSPAIAERLRLLGARPEALQITGSIKFDGTECRDDHPGLSALRAAFLMEHSGPVLVAGSTQEPEERLILDAWQQLQPEFPELTLILVPRHKERFDAVAELVQQRGCGLIRRSAGATAVDLPAARDSLGRPAVRLLDTIGELSACWGLADLAFVGGSFGNRGGQNMIEPAAWGAAVLFGPHTWNFRDVVQVFLEANACLQLADPADLLPALRGLLQDPAAAKRLGATARQTVQRQQGAVAVTIQLLLERCELEQHLPVQVITRAA